MPFFLIPCDCGHAARVLAQDRPLNRHMGQCPDCITEDFHRRENERKRKARVLVWREPVLTAGAKGR